MKKQLLLLLGLFVFASANAALVVDFSQVGSDVVVTTSGSVNTAGLSFKSDGSRVSAYIYVSPAGDIASALANTDFSRYSGYQVNGALGTGSQLFQGSSAVGDYFYISGANDEMDLPRDYVSGTPINSQMTFINENLSTLNPDTDFTMTWGSGANQDSLSITVGAVPEPATFLLFGLGGFGAWLLRRNGKPIS